MLDISTDEAGIEDGEPIEFVVKTELSAGSTSNLFIQEIMNYEDSSIISLTMNNLVPGARYQFSAKVQNKFGVSEFSNVIELQVQASSSDSTSSGNYKPNTVNREYFDVKIFSDSMACAKIKRTKYMTLCNINDNAVQGRLSENCLTRKIIA